MTDVIVPVGDTTFSEPKDSSDIPGPGPDRHMDVRKAVVVLMIYTGAVWVLYYTFGMFGPEFFRTGPGRQETVLDTEEGKRQFALFTVQCRLSASVLCAEQGAYWEQLLLNQPTTPLLRFSGLTVDTPGEYWGLMATSLLNYAVSYFGLNLVQQWITTDIQDVTKRYIRYTCLDVSVVRVAWILFEFTIFILDIIFAQVQVDIFLAGIVGYVISALLLTQFYIGDKVYVAGHAQSPMGESQPTQPIVQMVPLEDSLDVDQFRQILNSGY